MSADIAMTPAANVELSLAPQLPLAAVEMTPQQKAAAARAVKKAKKEAALAKAHATRMSKRIAATGVVSTETLAVTANTAAATAVTPALAISDDVSVAADDDHVKTPKTPVFADADTAEAMSTTATAPAAAVATGHVSAVGGGIWSAPAVAATAAAAAAAVPDVKVAEAPAPAAAEAPAVVLVISSEEKAARIAWLRSVANGVACSDSAKCNGLPNVCKASNDMIAALITECKKAKTATDDKFPYCYVCQKALKTTADLDADNDCKACHVTPMCYHFSLTNSKFGANWDAKAHAVQCLVKHETSSVGYCGKCLDNTQRAILPSGKADAVATVRRMVKAKWFKSKGQHVQHDVDVDLINPQVLATLNASHASKGAVKLEDIDTETLATIDQELVVEGHIDVNAVEEKALKKIKIDQVLGAKIRFVDICDLVDVAEGTLRYRTAELKTFTEVNSARKVITTLKAAAATAADEKKNAEAVKPPAKKKARTEKGAIDKDTTDSDTDAEADKPKAKAKAKAKGKSATDSSSSDADDKPKAKAKAKAVVSGSKRKTFDNDEVLAAARVIMAHAASKEAASKEAAQDAEIKRLQKQIRLLTAAAKSKERTAVVMSATSAAN